MFSEQYYPYKNFSPIKPLGDFCYVGCFLSSLHPKTGKTGAHGGKWGEAVQVYKKKKKKQEMIPEESISWSKGRETVKLDLLKKKMVQKKMVLSLGH